MIDDEEAFEALRQVHDALVWKPPTAPPTFFGPGAAKARAWFEAQMDYWPELQVAWTARLRRLTALQSLLYAQPHYEGP